MFSAFSDLFTVASPGSEDRRRELNVSKTALVRRLQRAIQTVLQHFALQGRGGTNTTTDDPLGEAADFLKDDAPGVWDMLTLIESCMFHGRKRDVPAAGMVYSSEVPVDCWEFICSLRSLDDPICSATLGMLASLVHARSPYARCRAWVRRLINQHALEYSLRALTDNSNTPEIRKWYHEGALLADPESSGLFVTMLSALNEVAFELLVDDARLESTTPSEWVCVVEGGGTHTSNDEFRRSGIRDHVLRYESARGMEIFRSDVSGTGAEGLTKRWFIGDPTKRVAHYYVNSPTDRPPIHGWIVHPSGGRAPPPKVFSFEVPVLSGETSGDKRRRSTAEKRLRNEMQQMTAKEEDNSTENSGSNNKKDTSGVSLANKKSTEVIAITPDFDAQSLEENSSLSSHSTAPSDALQPKSQQAEIPGGNHVDPENMPSQEILKTTQNYTGNSENDGNSESCMTESEVDRLDDGESQGANASPRNASPLGVSPPSPTLPVAFGPWDSASLPSPATKTQEASVATSPNSVIKRRSPKKTKRSKRKSKKMVKIEDDELDARKHAERSLKMRDKLHLVSPIKITRDKAKTTHASHEKLPTQDGFTGPSAAHHEDHLDVVPGETRRKEILESLNSLEHGPIEDHSQSLGNNMSANNVGINPGLETTTNEDAATIEEPTKSDSINSNSGQGTMIERMDEKSFVETHVEPNKEPTNEPDATADKEHKVEHNDAEPDEESDKAFNEEVDAETGVEPNKELDVECTVEPNKENNLAADEEPSKKPDVEAGPEPIKELDVEPHKEFSVVPGKQSDDVFNKEAGAEPNLESSKEHDIEPDEEPDVAPRKEPDVEPSKEHAVEPGEERNAEPSKEQDVEPDEERNGEPSKEHDVELDIELDVAPDEESHDAFKKEDDGETDLAPNKELDVEPDDKLSVVRDEVFDDAFNKEADAETGVEPNKELGVAADDEEPSKEPGVEPDDEPDVQPDKESDDEPGAESSLEPGTDPNTGFDVDHEAEPDLEVVAEPNTVPDVNVSVGLTTKPDLPSLTSHGDTGESTELQTEDQFNGIAINVIDEIVEIVTSEKAESTVTQSTAVSNTEIDDDTNNIVTKSIGAMKETAVQDFVAERRRLQSELEKLRLKRKEESRKRFADMYYSAHSQATSEKNDDAGSAFSTVSMPKMSPTVNPIQMPPDSNRRLMSGEDDDKSAPNSPESVQSEQVDPWTMVIPPSTNENATLTDFSGPRTRTLSSPALLQGSLLFRQDGCKISVNVTDFQMNVAPKPHVAYCIEVKETRPNAPSSSYTVRRRFNQFKELHKKLSKTLPKSVKVILPKLPSSSWRRSFDPEYIARMRKQLDSYIVKLAGILTGADNLSQARQEPFISFLATSSEDARIGDKLPEEGPLARESRGSSLGELWQPVMDSIGGKPHHEGTVAASVHGNDPIQPLENWSGVHISLKTDLRPNPGQRVATKIGIGLQRFVCGTCGGKLNASRKKDVRWCEYTELYHCGKCSSRRARCILPTRVINHWDFLKYRVCDEAAAFLDEVYEQPLLCVSALNPKLFEMVSQLRHVRLLRLQLIRMKDFVDTCRQGQELRRGLDEQGLGYLMDNTEMYSMRDLFKINSKELIKILMGVVEVIAVHISHECAQCSARGFICEMCDDQTPLYAFDILNVAACRGCNTFVHRRCIAASRPCRRCARLRQRKMKESEPKAASMQNAIGILAGANAPQTFNAGKIDTTRSIMSEQTQRMANAVQERRRRRGSREQPFGHFPRDFGISADGNNAKDFNSRSALRSTFRRHSQAAAFSAAEDTRMRASASSGPSVLGANYSGSSMRTGSGDTYVNAEFDESVSTGGPGDFAGLNNSMQQRGRADSRSRRRESSNGSDDWHWRTG